MYKLSVYGKGGVGKSTVSANLSFLISKRGLKVLHIGCDPKHDSTRLLTNGKSQKTFLDCMAEKGGEPIVTGSNGVACLECGGAEPGIGCAGKGMSAMFAYAEEHTPIDTDVRVCDVLGDVVCGGFGVPMRKTNVDGIIIVVSEDFMSLYAANNILRGIRNLNGTACVLGMVLNSRYPDGIKRVELFSEATGVPILGKLTQSRAFADAEARGQTVSELFPESDSCKELTIIADAAVNAMNGTLAPVEAHPLNDNAMTQIAAAMPVTDNSLPTVRKQCDFDTVDEVRGLVYKGRQAMPACTSHGAVHFLEKIEDAAIVLHGPLNCAWLMGYTWERDATFSMGLINQRISDNIYSTGMDMRVIFGGDRNAIQDTVKKAYDDGFRTVFVVMTCTPETIGTDLEGECGRIDLPGLKVIPVRPDVKSLGSKFGGRLGAHEAVAGLIDRSRPIEKDTVLMLGVAGRVEEDPVGMKAFEELFEAFGLRLKYMFPGRTTLDIIKDLNTCEYIIAPARGFFLDEMKSFFPDRKLIPAERFAGIRGVRDWCAMLSEATGRSDGGYLKRKEKEYVERLAPYRKKLEGKKALFYNRNDFAPDNVIDVVLDLGMVIPAIVSWPDNFEDRNPKVFNHPDIPRIKDVEFCHFGDLAKEMGADIIVSGDPRTGSKGMVWTGMFAEHVGCEESISWARKLCNSMVIKPKQSWRL